MAHIPRNNVCPMFDSLSSATTIVHDYEHFSDKLGAPVRHRGWDKAP